MSPDGVHIDVPWDTLRVGYSLFIPCINTERAKVQVKEVFAVRGWKPKIADRIEKRCLGIRVWRVA